MDPRNTIELEVSRVWLLFAVRHLLDSGKAALNLTGVYIYNPFLPLQAWVRRNPSV
jgi:hypothetical protein